MSRKLRIEYPGAICHPPALHFSAAIHLHRGYGRAGRNEDIFHDEVDRQDFVKSPAEGFRKTGRPVHAYCLMRNHFNLGVELPDANLVSGMRRLLSDYTIRLSKCHKLLGNLFSGNHSGDLLRENRDAKAGRIAREDLRRLRWVEAVLSRRPKNDPANLALAARLRRETTLTIAEIAVRVKPGASKRANARPHAWMKNSRPRNKAICAKQRNEPCYGRPLYAVPTTCRYTSRLVH